MILLSVYILIVILRHWYIIEIEHRSPDKRKASMMRAFFGSVLVMGQSTSDLSHDLPIAMFAMFGFWFCFDYGLNLIRGVKPFYYLNSTGPIDLFQHRVLGAHTWFWIKLNLMLATILLHTP